MRLGECRRKPSRRGAAAFARGRGSAAATRRDRSRRGSYERRPANDSSCRVSDSARRTVRWITSSIFVDAGGGAPTAQCVDAHPDHLEQVVEVVSDAARELPDRLHLLRLRESSLRRRSPMHFRLQRFGLPREPRHRPGERTMRPNHLQQQQSEHQRRRCDDRHATDVPVRPCSVRRRSWVSRVPLRWRRARGSTRGRSGARPIRSHGSRGA